MRPCGACRKLIPADHGCEHWTPGRSAKVADSAARRAALRAARPPAPEPVRTGTPRQERSRAAMDRRNELARARYAAKKAGGREVVAEFARIMGRNQQ